MEVGRRHGTNIHGSKLAKRELEVKLREFTLKRMIRGVEVIKPTGFNYVDVYFPDGTQRTCGYIGLSLNGAFAPLSGIDKDLAAIIQGKINELAGHAKGEGPMGPDILPTKDNDE